MDIFGARWQNYVEKIREDWLNKVTEEDVVLIAGDISWAMGLDDAEKDIRATLYDLPGKKVRRNSIRYFNTSHLITSPFLRNIVSKNLRKSFPVRNYYKYLLDFFSEI